jgi:hypothetical protein
MSAVATAEAVPASDAVPVHLVAPAGMSTYEMHAAEQMRWMVWFGTPVLFASLFFGVAFSTGQALWIGGAIAAIMVDIFVLVWLAMTSDTNGTIGHSLPAAH